MHPVIVNDQITVQYETKETNETIKTGLKCAQHINKTWKDRGDGHDQKSTNTHEERSMFLD